MFRGDFTGLTSFLLIKFVFIQQQQQVKSTKLNWISYLLLPRFDNKSDCFLVVDFKCSQFFRNIHFVQQLGIMKTTQITRWNLSNSTTLTQVIILKKPSDSLKKILLQNKILLFSFTFKNALIFDIILNIRDTSLMWEELIIENNFT